VRGQRVYGFCFSSFPLACLRSRTRLRESTGRAIAYETHLGACFSMPCARREPTGRAAAPVSCKRIRHRVCSVRSAAFSAGSPIACAAARFPRIAHEARSRTVGRPTAWRRRRCLTDDFGTGDPPPCARGRGRTPTGGPVHRGRRRAAALRRAWPGATAVAATRQSDDDPGSRTGRPDRSGRRALSGHRIRSPRVRLQRAAAYDRVDATRTGSAALEGAAATAALQRPVVAGHSFGALVALCMALDFPREIRSLVLLSGYYFPTPRADTFYLSAPAVPVIGDLLRHTVSPWLFRLLWPGIVARLFSPAPVCPTFRAFPTWMALRPSQLRSVGADSALMIPAVAALRSRYPELSLPVVILAGTDDRHVDTGWHSVRLHRLIADSELTLVPGAGHMVQHTDLDEVMAAIDAAASAPGSAGETRPAATSPVRSRRRLQTDSSLRETRRAAPPAAWSRPALRSGRLRPARSDSSPGPTT
jgi:pimeloyl-ACP methyl ester carboxylesterase